MKHKKEFKIKLKTISIKFQDKTFFLKHVKLTHSTLH